ncbi:MAG: polyprenol monophosphomannose synthase [Deltaproteobacteria bacterium]|nr:polyprenol monophosphomannose synthase [Deltaproteobacteria bacterium]
MIEEQVVTDKSGKVLICIPTYNEKQNLSRIVSAVFNAVPDLHILVIDDNSPDGTGRIADEISQNDPRVHVLHRYFKKGLGTAYLEGFSWALTRGYAFIFEFDADFSHNPEYLPGFISLLRSGEADVVVGSRCVNGGGVVNREMYRRFISWGGSVYARLILGGNVRDLTGGFNGFCREALQRIDLERIKSNGYCFQIELKYRCIKRGMRVVERPIIFPDRAHGASKMSNSIFSEALWHVLKLRFDKNI